MVEPATHFVSTWVAKYSKYADAQPRSIAIPAGSPDALLFDKLVSIAGSMDTLARVNLFEVGDTSICCWAYNFHDAVAKCFTPVLGGPRLQSYYMKPTPWPYLHAGSPMDELLLSDYMIFSIGNTPILPVRRLKLLVDGVLPLELVTAYVYASYMWNTTFLADCFPQETLVSCFKASDQDRLTPHGMKIFADWTVAEFATAVEDIQDSSIRRWLQEPRSPIVATAGMWAS